MLLSRKAVSCDFESAPTRVASTLPFLNSISVGMPRMPNFAGTLWFSSTLILAIFSRPSYSLATSSSIGAIDLQGPHMLVIDPDECIDCTLCVPECPVEAIFAEDDVPDAQKEFIALNRERAQVWKPIIERKSPPPDADQWVKVKDKKKFLEK